MKRRLQIIIVLGIVLTMSLISPAYANDITVTVNKEFVEFKEPPIIQNDRTLVPLRAIFEALGLEVKWDQETRSITALKDNVIIKLKIDDLNISVGDPEIGIIETVCDVAPQIINDTTYVPARLIANLTGSSVFWEPDTNNVRIVNNEFDEFARTGSSAVGREFEHIGYYNRVLNNYFGIGKRVYGNGDVYVGGFLNGYLDGFGILNRDGFEFKGNWEKSRLNGPGSIEYPNGDKCVGTFKEGKMYGDGEFSFSNGNKYIGNFEAGKFSGYGVEYFKDGARYEGEWAPGEDHMGLMNGQGTFYYPDGRAQSGTWKDGHYVK